MTTNYQEPIEQKDLEIGKKVSEGKVEEKKEIPAVAEKKEVIQIPEVAPEADGEIVEKGPDFSEYEETAKEIQESKKETDDSEKIETARKAITAQPAQPAAKVSDDAQTVSQIQEFEKKVEKLVEIAVQKGPEHAIQVAQHMDKGKDPTTADNYTIDEIHDRLMEDELRSQLVAKGLLREL